MRMAQIFVAVLGASSFTFAKASWTQALPDWIDAHVRAFEAIGGVPELVVPDNAKTAGNHKPSLRSVDEAMRRERWTSGD
jgi:transposase